MFLCGMVESTSDEIHIQNVDSRIMQLIVDYAYTGEILISSQNVERLLAASVLLQVQAVTVSCCTFLGNKMTPLNCMAIARFATTHASPECQALWEKAVEYSFTRFSEVSKSDDFLQLPEEELVQILTNERLFTRVRMSAYSSASRKCFLQLWGGLKGIITPVLTDSTDSCPWSTLADFLSHFSANNSPIRSKPLRYSPSGNVWTCVASMPSPRIGHGCAVLYRHLYAVGGIRGDSRLSSVIRYSPDDDVWTEVASLNFPRSGAGWALQFMLSMLCYVLSYLCGGGYDGENIMSSVERYDPLTDTWSLMSPMPVPVSGLACTAVCPDIIFAFGVISVHILGGYNGREFVNHLQIYNIESDQWRNQPTDNFGRTGHGVIVGGRPQIIHQLVFVDYCRMRGQNIYYMCGSIK
ncbi:kelch-like protein 20 [Octopus sinensis]|uniref:Kelch-like protein 20 n=1 Tax=Octopus sinensis TaxID=2607531 RepID=A0A6P7U942_9MOLL|nr:kelch-like protein 20 [Octopus sinensis]